MMSLTSRLLLLLSLVVVSASTSAGCGGDDDDDDTAGDSGGGDDGDRPDAGGGDDGDDPDAGGDRPDAGGDGDPDAGDDDPDAGDGDPDASIATGQIRFVHAATLSAAPEALDVYVRPVGQPEPTAPLFPGAVYGTATDYATISAGSYLLVVRSAGEPVGTTPRYTSEPIAVTADGSVTALAGGLLASPGPGQEFRITGLADDFGPVAPGTTRVRIVNQSHAIPTLDIDVGGDGTNEVTGLDRFADVAELEIPIGSAVDLAVVRNPLPPPPSPTQPISDPRHGTFIIPASVLVDGGEVYAVITGLSTIRPRDPRRIQLIFLSAGGPPVAVQLSPMVYLLPASPDAAALDAFIGNVKVFDNQAFGALKLARLRPTTTGHTLNVHLHTDGTTPPATPALASLSTGPLEAGQQYLAILNGFVAPGADPLAILMVRDDLQVATDATGKLRAIHVAHGVAQIDVGRIGAPPDSLWQDIADFAGLSPRGVSPAVGTPIVDGANPASVNPAVRATAEPAVEIRFGNMSALSSTDRVYGVIAGAWVPAAGQRAIHYMRINTAAVNWRPEPPRAPVISSLPNVRRAAFSPTCSRLECLITTWFSGTAAPARSAVSRRAPR